MSEEKYQQDLGEIQGKLEMFMQQSIEQRRDMLEAIKNVQREVSNISSELQTYKTVATVIKYIAMMILAFLTFKFGDAINLWHSILGALHADIR